MSVYAFGASRAIAEHVSRRIAELTEAVEDARRETAAVEARNAAALAIWRGHHESWCQAARVGAYCTPCRMAAALAALGAEVTP